VRSSTLLAGIGALATAAPGPAPGATYLIDAGGGGDYLSIQDALDAANSGDRLEWADDGDWLGHNLCLAPGSPAIDAGDPDPAFNDPDGSRNDLGAFGGPGAPDCTYMIDADGDGYMPIMGDCDDADPAVFPLAPGELACDRIDTDCDTLDPDSPCPGDDDSADDDSAGDDDSAADDDSGDGDDSANDETAGDDDSGSDDDTAEDEPGADSAGVPLLLLAALGRRPGRRRAGSVRARLVHPWPP
jgi:hypothetical protein